MYTAVACLDHSSSAVVSIVHLKWCFMELHITRIIWYVLFNYRTRFKCVLWHYVLVYLHVQVVHSELLLL